MLEKAKRKEGSQYARSLIEASLDPLVTISAQGKITDLNAATANITGLTRSQLVGTDFLDYFTEPQKAREVYEEIFAKGSVSDYPLTLRHTSGILTDVLFNGSVYKDDKGNINGAVIVARDVTEQKQASRYARSLIEASRDPLVTVSLEGKITDVNEASAKVTGFKREKLIGTDFSDYFTKPKVAREVYKEVFAKGSVTDSPLILRHKDGKLSDVLFNGSVYKDDWGTVLGVVIVARDVTERKRIATELTDAKTFAEHATKVAKKAKKKAESATLIAENAVKAKQQFLSNMSHEIRTPMNAIIGFTKVVLKTELTAKQTEYLNAIKSSGDALIVLINDILDLAKVDAGKMHFDKTVFNLSASLSAMLNLFEIKIQEKNLTLTKLIDENIPEVLIGDPMRLHQIILNLVSNAVKFTSHGEITINVNLISVDEESVSIEFAISDTGIGIPADKLENIFENFQQANSDTSKLYGGTGLGLAIVKQLIEAQNGIIKVESRLGEGSTFSFILDFDKTSSEAAKGIEILEIDDEVIGSRILVVEDIALNQLLMKTLLEDFKFQCDIASNGKIAIEKLQQNTYDLILMDLQMPVMDGFETTEYIRKQMHSNIPIIALTAGVTIVDRKKCTAVGMNDYIAKPVDENLLYSKIFGILKKSTVESSEKLIDEIDELKGSCISLKYLNRITKSEPKLMIEMISLYLSETEELMKQLKRSTVERDWNTVELTAHKMIPLFATVGIQDKYELMAREVLKVAKSRKHTDEIPELVLKLEHILFTAFAELRVELERIKNVKV